MWTLICRRQSDDIFFAGVSGPCRGISFTLLLRNPGQPTGNSQLSFECNLNSILKWPGVDRSRENDVNGNHGVLQWDNFQNVVNGKLESTKETRHSINPATGKSRVAVRRSDQGSDAVTIQCLTRYLTSDKDHVIRPKQISTCK
jgi:hypothetical protein